MGTSQIHGTDDIFGISLYPNDFKEGAYQLRSGMLINTLKMNLPWMDGLVTPTTTVERAIF